MDRANPVVDEAATEGGWEAEPLGMEDDHTLPQLYTGCDARARRCTVRIA